MYRDSIGDVKKSVGAGLEPDRLMGESKRMRAALKYDGYLMLM